MMNHLQSWQSPATTFNHDNHQPHHRRWSSRGPALPAAPHVQRWWKGFNRCAFLGGLATGWMDRRAIHWATGVWNLSLFTFAYLSIYPSIEPLYLSLLSILFDLSISLYLSYLLSVSLTVLVCLLVSLSKSADLDLSLCQSSVFDEQSSALLAARHVEHLDELHTRFTELTVRHRMQNYWTTAFRIAITSHTHISDIISSTSSDRLPAATFRKADV